ncbi:hypothetical protein NW198_00350 [Thermophilibacter sp. ET337]|uniref:hypothetical protein n=1 Tax=Thermophilibacter sp. ET337 TaxID=2973084 RepID=UPI0021AC63CA|nr:hypothetical protein [Thermophilibacter sp. ET337]MCR8907071.1 hypothetical protein [Thermophilibacter sp. ET337]
MKNTAEALRTTIRRRLRRERILLAVMFAAWASLVALITTDTLPALHGDARISGFLSGFMMGMFTVAAGITARQVLSLRRALRDEAELRRFLARENDELQAHLEREVARAYVQLLPALAVVAVLVGALVSFESMVSVAATLVFLALVLLAVKIYYKRALATPEAE